MPIRSNTTQQVYKFVHRKNEYIQTSIKGIEYEHCTGWLKINKDGLISICPPPTGYAWDGCTPKFEFLDFLLGTPDGKLDYFTEKPITYYASMIHDILYQFKEEVPLSRLTSDKLFREILRQSEFKWGGLYYAAVRCFGGTFGKWKTPSKIKKIEINECSWIKENYKAYKKLKSESAKNYPLAKIGASYEKRNTRDNKA